MKIIQSFWSGQNNDPTDNRGWLSHEYHWLGWILSCNQLRKFYDEVELYTDTFGYEILINKLNLPYTKVHVVLDEMNKYPQDLWAIAKIHTYALQNSSFLHVDGDVFIWDKFPQELMSSSLIAQNLENTTDYYREMWNKITPNLNFIPEEIYDYHKGLINLGCNMGIIGGSDLDFFRLYTKKSFEFVDKNSDSWSDFNLFNFNIFFEQELFYEMTLKNKKNISYLFNEVWGDNSYLGLGSFQEVPHKRFFLHLLGDFKRRESVCKYLEAYTIKNYSQYVYKLREIFPEKFIFLNSFREMKYHSPDFCLNIKIEQFIDAVTNTENGLSNKLLFERNLLFVNIFKKFDEIIDNGKDMLLILLNCFEIIEEDEEDVIRQENRNLKVKEYDETYIAYDFDDIDKIIIEELKKPIMKNTFLKNMYNYLEDGVSDEEILEFKTLMINRLRYFLECKILLIYESEIK